MRARSHAHRVVQLRRAEVESSGSLLSRACPHAQAGYAGIAPAYPYASRRPVCMFLRVWCVCVTVGADEAQSAPPSLA